jgi:hypothetical protein
MSWFPTDWSFVTSAGAEITGGEILNIGGGGGAFYVRNRRTRNVHELTYGVVTAGGGFGFPVNIDVSTVDMPSHGIGPILGNNRHFLRPSDFEGGCAMAGIQVAIGSGESVLSVFFNVPVFGLWTDARAWGKIAGKNVGLQLGAGAMFYAGYISCVG